MIKSVNLEKRVLTRFRGMPIFGEMFCVLPGGGA